MASVIIVAFDGLQPHHVRPELMPNLAEFAKSGVSFARHHSVFPSMTRPNVASLVTGCYPGRHGLMANTLVVPGFNANRSFPAMEPQLGLLARQTEGVLLVPTLAEILADGGREYWAVGVGTSGNAYLHNPNAYSSGGATIHPEFCLPSNLHTELEQRFGTWPEAAVPNVHRMAHARRIMTDYVLAERAPAVAAIWLSEPDSTQHLHGIGSGPANEAAQAADAQFGRLLDWLALSGGDRDRDVIVVSDHGSSTIHDVVDVEEFVVQWMADSQLDFEMEVVPNGGCVLLYVEQIDLRVRRQLVEWLMEQPWCGNLIISQGEDIPGTLAAGLIGYQGRRTPDISISLKWDAGTNEAGIQGRSYSTGGAVRQSQHGSLSPLEMRCVMFAQGPSFKSNATVTTPSANTDVLPTVLRIVGLDSREPVDGRVLEEALVGGPDSTEIQWTEETHRAETTVTGGSYRQQVTVLKVGESVYIDEGRARFEASKEPGR